MEQAKRDTETILVKPLPGGGQLTLCCPTTPERVLLVDEESINWNGVTPIEIKRRDGSTLQVKRLASA